MELTAKGVRVHYEQMGERGKNVLLLHGWGCSIQGAAPSSISSPLPRI